jgi:tetratricopeptide (TPR) repeat protein
MRAARFAEAIKHFQTAIDLDGSYVEAWYESARALEALGRYPDAIASLDRTRALDPQGHGAVALFSIGNCHVRLGDLPRAIECFDQALAMEPRLTRAWHNRGMALLEGRFEEASRSYAQAARLKPASAGICLWQGYCLERLGRQDEAEECFARASRSNAPHDVANAWMQIGAYLHTRNKPEQSLGAYDRALHLRPTWGVAWERRGVCLAQLDRDHEALTAFNRAISIDDSSKLSACAHKGALLMKLGQQRAATAIYERVLDVPPGSAQDHRARAQAFGALGRPAERPRPSSTLPNATFGPR